MKKLWWNKRTWWNLEIRIFSNKNQKLFRAKKKENNEFIFLKKGLNFVYRPQFFFGEFFKNKAFST